MQYHQYLNELNQKVLEEAKLQSKGNFVSNY